MPQATNFEKVTVEPVTCTKCSNQQRSKVLENEWKQARVFICAECGHVNEEHYL